MNAAQTKAVQGETTFFMTGGKIFTLMKISISKMANNHITHRRGMAAPDYLEGRRDGGRVMRAAFSAAKTFGSKPTPANPDSA
jgi:hypothetical protein